MTQKKHINEILPPTQSRDNPANLFMFTCFLFLERTCPCTPHRNPLGEPRLSLPAQVGRFGGNLTIFLSRSHWNGHKHSANRGLPLPLGRGVCETKSKNGRVRPRKNPLFVGFSVLRWGIETMVSEHGLGRGQNMG